MVGKAAEAKLSGQTEKIGVFERWLTAEGIWQAT